MIKQTHVLVQGELVELKAHEHLCKQCGKRCHKPPLCSVCKPRKCRKCGDKFEPHKIGAGICPRCRKTPC